MTGFAGISIALACSAALLPASTPARADDRQKILDAMTWASPVLGKACDFASFRQDGEIASSHYYDIRFRYSGQDQDSPDNVFPLYALLCARAAHDASFIYLTRDGNGYRLLSFAEPKLDYDYTDESFSKLKGPPKVIGYRASSTLTGSAFDPASRSITMLAKWRDLGDAWSSGQWNFVEGEFVLKRYSVDPTYNSAPDNQENDSESYQVFPDIRLEH